MLRRTAKYLAVVLIVLVIGGALALGLHFLGSELPTPRETVESGPVAPDFAPRRAGIPWKRDLGDTGGVKVAAVVFPWEKAAGPRAGVVVLPLPAGFPNGRADARVLQEVTTGLGSGKAEEFAGALARAKGIAAEQPLSAMGQLRGVKAAWSAAMIGGKHFAELDELAGGLVVRFAHDTSALEGLLTVRVRCAILMGDGAEAAHRARELVAISWAQDTGTAIGLLIEALPKDEGKALREELTATGGSGRLRLDAGDAEQRMYAKAAEEVTAVDIGSVTARGNLLLLGGKAEEARRAFARGCAIATEGQLPAEVEGMARCAREETGVVRR